VEKAGVLAVRNDVVLLRTPKIPERRFGLDLDIPARAEVIDVFEAVRVLEAERHRQ
jgi:hypothetical protein